MTLPDWQDALPNLPTPRGSHLLEAWLTTFDRPDAGFLVQHLLPALLGATQGLTQDPQARNLFFGELDDLLKPLRDRFTIISSPLRETGLGSPYPWLWRYVNHFTVGAEQHAVQHAKLWAFHWKIDGVEHLELIISSANLTASAFKEQIQAGWRVLLPMSSGVLDSRQVWGELVSFLEALGRAAGDIARGRVLRLIGLLGRTKCPAGVSFIASIPGQKSPARRLAEFKPTELHILVPTVGAWNDQDLSVWMREIGVKPSKIHLKWISQDHPWVDKNPTAWTLPTSACKSLQNCGVQLHRLAQDGRLAEQHRVADARWSHAKLYLLYRRQKCQLLITSANWSPAAWGARTSPRNFELGVLIDTEWTALKDVDSTFRPPETRPYCIDRASDDPPNAALGWAEAAWDGTRIKLQARSDSAADIVATIAFSGGHSATCALSQGAGLLPWAEAERVPLTVTFVQGEETIEVDVLDLRPPGEFDKTLPPEADRASAEDLRTAFLLQRYGGADVEQGAPDALGEERAPSTGASPADYSVQAWNDAREGFETVDRWVAALADAEKESMAWAQVRVDGESLRAYYAKKGDTAAALVAEELSWRLNEEG